MILATFVTFISFLFLVTHLPKRWMLRIVGYKGLADLTIHGTILYMFLGTSTDGLLQAEAAGILFSLYIRGYRYIRGYEVRRNGKWVRFPPGM